MGDRHTVRAKWHDYSGGIYFITICTHNKEHTLGRIKNGVMQYTTLGTTVCNCLSAIPDHHPQVELRNYVVMPNHIHMVIAVGAQYFAPALPGPPAPPLTPSNTGCLKPPRHGEPCIDNHFNSRLAVIVRSFKAACLIEYKRYRGAMLSDGRAQNMLSDGRAQNMPSDGRAQNMPSDGRAQNMPSDGRAQNIAPLLMPLWQRNYHEHIIRTQQAHPSRLPQLRRHALCSIYTYAREL